MPRRNEAMAKERFTPQLRSVQDVMDRNYEGAVAARELGVLETTLRY